MLSAKKKIFIAFLCGIVSASFGLAMVLPIERESKHLDGLSLKALLVAHSISSAAFLAGEESESLYPSRPVQFLEEYKVHVAREGNSFSVIYLPQGPRTVDTSYIVHLELSTDGVMKFIDASETHGGASTKITPESVAEKLLGKTLASRNQHLESEQ